MPKMYVHAVTGTFDAAARVAVARELTKLGRECEKLPDTELVRGSTWVWFVNHSADGVFSGGEVATGGLITLVVYSLRGGLDGNAKTALIENATQILECHAHPPASVPTFVIIHEVDEANWGMAGVTGNLDALRHSSDRLAPSSHTYPVPDEGRPA